ncbi:hypothetical protein B0H13DRAFT_1896658 [Mycena leptocephala]|nr:hypothetical protein B0H13DRAFT_1896658 [Mycena leptocephala]
MASRAIKRSGEGLFFPPTSCRSDGANKSGARFSFIPPDTGTWRGRGGGATRMRHTILHWVTLDACIFLSLPSHSSIPSLSRVATSVFEDGSCGGRWLVCPRSSRVEYTWMRMDVLCGCPGRALGRRISAPLGSSVFDARGMKWAGKGGKGSANA